MRSKPRHHTADPWGGQPPADPAALRAFMAWHQVRQVQVAERLGVVQSRVSMVLAGKVLASRKALERLRRAILEVVRHGRNCDG
jgi:predicted transcriptional regulator